MADTHNDTAGQGMATINPGDITERLRQEFRVRDWWPGMNSYDSALGETVPHPVAAEAAAEIERLREMAGRHDPTGADHMEEMWVHAQRADAAEDAIQILAGFIRFDSLSDEDRALVERLTAPHNGS